jgi:hypothetical protein
MSLDHFVGTWKLFSFELRSSIGEVTYPFGRDAVGYIMYTNEGFMSVNFMKADRLNYVSGDFLKGTAEEKISAIDTFQSYCGRYEVSGNKVVHHIEVSSFPNWSGVDQERFFKFKENNLELNTPPILLGGKNQTAHLVWEKV